MDSTLTLPALIAILVFLIWLFNCLNIMREYERGGRLSPGPRVEAGKGPGLVLILWPIDKIVKVSLRVVTGTSRRRTSSRATTCP